MSSERIFGGYDCYPDCTYIHVSRHPRERSTEKSVSERMATKRQDTREAVRAGKFRSCARHVLGILKC